MDKFLHGDQFRYSERPQQPPAGVAPLDFFLNVSHEGYCQHYAGAMALLLRMGGVPARVATGFSPGGYSARRKAWIVRDTDAHAWVEAWFDRFGWVTFDPTPDATPARSQIATLAQDNPLPPISADRIPSDAAGNAAGGARGPQGLRPDLLLDRDRADGSGGGLQQNGRPWFLYGVGAAAAAPVAVVRGAPPVPPAAAPRWTGRSPSSRPGAAQRRPAGGHRPRRSDSSRAVSGVTPRRRAPTCARSSRAAMPLHPHRRRARAAAPCAARWPRGSAWAAACGPVGAATAHALKHRAPLL